jgi:hypothetical protein
VLLRGVPEIFRDLPWEARAWTLTTIGILLGVVIAVLLIGDWLRGWWLTNLLRNRLHAKRRLKREGREPDLKP